MVVAAAVASTLAFADVSAPEVAFAGYINGTMQIWMVADQTTPARYAYEVQMKTGQGAYETVGGDADVWSQHYLPGTVKGRRWALKTSWAGAASFRVRASEGGSFSDWTEIPDPFTCTMAQGGTVLMATGEAQGANAFDGDNKTSVAGLTTSWTGLDFGSEKTVTKIRFVAAYNIPGKPAEFVPSSFQCATDETFSDAVTVYDITAADFAASNRVIEIDLPQPVTARYFRHLGRSSKKESIAELEFVPEGIPLVPSLTVEPVDYADFYARATWEVPPVVNCASSVLERATTSVGPWTAMSDWILPPAETSFEDASLAISRLYYYRVRAVCDYPGCEGTVIVSDAVPYRRLKRLGQNADATFKDGVTLLPQVGADDAAQTKAATQGMKALDGNLTTMSAAYGLPAGLLPVLGLDLGTGVHFALARVAMDETWIGRTLGGVAVYGANAADLSDGVPVSPEIVHPSADVPMWANLASTDEQTQFRKLYLKEKSTASWAWVGASVRELELYGWEDSDASWAVAPVSVFFTRNAASITVRWTEGRNLVSYGIQRRSAGADSWTTVATDIPSGTLTYEDVTAESGNRYEYRVSAQGSDAGDVAYSEIFACYFFTPGSGTGLRVTFLAPYDIATYTFDQLTSSESRVYEGPVDYSLKANESIFSGSDVKDNAIGIWEGKIVIPETARYTLTLENDAGGAIEVDGRFGLAVNNSFAANSWNKSKSPTPVYSETLTAGEHDLRLWWRHASGDKRVRFTWASASIQEELVPASQLLAAEKPCECRIGDWRFITLGQAEVGAYRQAGEAIEATFVGGSVGRGNGGGYYLYREALAANKIELSARMESLISRGDNGLFVRDGTGRQVALVLTGASSSEFSAKLRTTEADGSYADVNVDFHDDKTHAPWLRLVAKDGVVKFYGRKWRDTEWTEITSATYRPAGKLHTGTCCAGTGWDPYVFTYSDITYRERGTGLMILLK